MNAMTLTRLSDDALAQLVGAAAVAKRRARNVGGAAAARGHDYEQLFIAHRVARLLMKFEATGTDAIVEWQSAEFIDDVVVRRDSALCVKAYQLKNTQEVSWTANKNTITEDFQLQATVSAIEGYTRTRLRLVCSDRDRATRLNNGVPATIAAQTRAIFFPYHEKVQKVIEAHAWMRDDFAFLSRHMDPSLVDCVDVASVLAGAWSVLKPAAAVSAVFQQARRTSPTILRPFVPGADPAARLRPEVRVILDGLPGFDYDIVRGFLKWSLDAGNTSGTLKIDCFDPDFDALQDQIVQRMPATFEEIEELL